jgi:hypothetical protein
MRERPPITRPNQKGKKPLPGPVGVEYSNSSDSHIIKPERAMKTRAEN